MGRTARLLLIGLLTWTGVTILLPGAVQAGEKKLGHGASHYSRVEARLATAGTNMNDLIDGRSSRNLWRTLKSGGSFSVSTVRDLFLYTYWRRLSGEHLMTMMFYGPDGRLYQQRVLPISIGTPSSPTRSVPGVEGPVDVQQTIPSSGYDVSIIQLPVAGTWITEHRLLGLWRVDVFLDGASSPLVSGSFSLTE
jgi:hypothetical protein